jgi:hypothetical protein
MRFTNEKAHELLNIFHSLCDTFNENGFMDYKDNKSLLDVFLMQAQECYAVIKYLHAMDDCEATNAYIDFARRLMLRLSCLIHEGRKETDLERFEHFCR